MRRFLVPEVLQTTAVDCGPAALKILLEGFDVAASYERLREACHTGVDGTSIDDVEEAARALGLDAEQGVLPIDHLLLAEAGALPAIVVTRTATRFTHFVVAWRRVGPWVQLGDPAVGRRWVRARAFEEEVLEHAMTLPASQWRAWASTEGFLRPLRARMAGLGMDAIDARVAEALTDTSWRSLAALDASVRAVAGLARDVRMSPRERATLAVALFERVRRGDEGHALVPATCWTARSAGKGDDGDEQVVVRGAVSVHVRGTRSREGDAPLSAELGAAIAQPPPRLASELWAMVARGPGASAPALWLTILGAVFAAVVAPLSFGGVPGLLVGCARAPRLAVAWAASALAWWLACAGASAAGARVEGALWRRFVAKVPRLEDAYFQSRPISDLAIRAHGLGLVRELPRTGLEIIAASLALAVTTGALAWVDPRSSPLAALLAVTSFGLPLLGRAWLAERESRVQAHDSALGRYAFEALCGVTALRAHVGDVALRREAASRRAAWMGAAIAHVRGLAAGDVASGAVTIAVMAALLLASAAHGLEERARMAVALWTLLLPWAGRRLAEGLRAWSAARAAYVRLVEPLNAPEPPEVRAQGALANGDGGVAIALRGVSVRAAGRTILHGVDLDLRAGEHVAIVGPSGAGKSSLAGLLLGWHVPFEGEVRVDGVALDRSACVALRRRTAWVDPQVRLWNRSLRENVLYGEPEDAAIGEALERAELRDLVERWPEGLATSLGEGGGRVSGGEGQRVRLARAFVRRGVRLAVLDEAFRGLERDVRGALLARAREHWRGATLLCVTHDVRETMELDRVIVIDGGRVVEDGVPRELAAGDTRYRALLDAETAVAEELAPWRRARLEEGAVREAPRPAGAERRAEREASARAPGPGLPAWPDGSAADATIALARLRGWKTRDPHRDDPAGDDSVRVVEAMGLEAEPVAITFSRFPAETRRGAWLLPSPSGGLVALVDGKILRPDGGLVDTTPEDLGSAFFGAAMAALAPSLDALLDAAGARGGRRVRLRETFLDRAVARPLESCVRIRARGRAWPVSAMLLALPLRLVAGGALFASLVVLARARPGVGAWASLLLAALVANGLALALSGSLAARIGGDAKARRFEEAAGADLDGLRADGVGRHIGRILAGSAWEVRGLAAFTAGSEALVLSVLASAALAIAGAIGGLVLLLALLLILLLDGIVRARAVASAQDARLALTHAVVEEMSGQRTRVVQLPPERWHERDEPSIAHHEARSARADRTLAVLSAPAVVWFAVALLIGPRAAGLHELLVVAGVVFGGLALSRASSAVRDAIDARDARRRARIPAPPLEVPVAGGGLAGSSAPLLEALGVGIAMRGAPVLARCDLRLERGDRVLLEGPSGSGKSTLAGILASFHPPTQGEVRLRGRSSASVDPRAWRRRVVLVPQFGDNHVFAESLAFNLLLGRAWPPRDADLAEAEAVCRELGLGELLERMPGGLEQMVGETGWQLSHGERSRVFLGRALLQRPDVVLLDESVAALDPETLGRVLRCVTARAETVLLVAHP